LCADGSSMDETVASTVLALVAAEPGITLADVTHRVPKARADLLYTLIATGAVYVDLHRAPLAEPERVYIFRDADTSVAHTVMTEMRRQGPFDRPPSVELTIGATVTWDGRPWTMANLGETTTALLGESGAFLQLPNATVQALVSTGKLTGVSRSGQPNLSAEAQARFAKASPADLQGAHRRYMIIRPRLTGEGRAAEGTPDRTVSDWVARWRRAEQVYGCGLLGLLPRLAESGNRGRKLPEGTIVVMQEVIEKEYETLTQKSKAIVHAALVRICAERGLVTPSYRTFVAEVNRRPREVQVARRRGRRAAYPLQPIYWDLDLTTPRHGDRPFEIGHVDHTELDIELLSSDTGQNLGRPWLTLLVDAFLPQNPRAVPHVRCTQLPLVLDGAPRVRAPTCAPAGDARGGRRPRVRQHVL
jgi:putative transposase